MTSPVCLQLQTNCCVTANLEKGTDHAPIVSGRSAHVVLRSRRKVASNCLQSNRLRLRHRCSRIVPFSGPILTMRHAATLPREMSSAETLMN